MKLTTILFVTPLLLFTGCSSIPKKSINETAINVVIKMVNGIDKKDWETSLDQFEKYVFVDYSSMNGQPGSKVKSKDLVMNWKKLLEHARTHHMLTNFEVTMTKKDEVEIFSHVYASHEADHIEYWDIYGRYHHKLKKVNGEWKIFFMKLLVHGQKGNLKFLEQLSKSTSLKN